MGLLKPQNPAGRVAFSLREASDPILWGGSAGQVYKQQSEMVRGKRQHRPACSRHPGGSSLTEQRPLGPGTSGTKKPQGRTQDRLLHTDMLLIQHPEAEVKDPAAGPTGLEGPAQVRAPGHGHGQTASPKDTPPTPLQSLAGGSLELQAPDPLLPSLAPSPQPAGKSADGGRGLGRRPRAAHLG